MSDPTPNTAPPDQFYPATDNTSGLPVRCSNCATKDAIVALRARVTKLETALWEVGDYNDSPDAPWTQDVVEAVLGEGWWHRRPDQTVTDDLLDSAAAVSDE